MYSAFVHVTQVHVFACLLFKLIAAALGAALQAATAALVVAAALVAALLAAAAALVVAAALVAGGAELAVAPPVLDHLCLRN